MTATAIISESGTSTVSNNWLFKDPTTGHSLPVELALTILSYLNSQDTGSVALTCRDGATLSYSWPVKLISLFQNSRFKFNELPFIRAHSGFYIDNLAPDDYAGSEKDLIVMPQNQGIARITATLSTFKGDIKMHGLVFMVARKLDHPTSPDHPKGKKYVFSYFPILTNPYLQFLSHSQRRFLATLT